MSELEEKVFNEVMNNWWNTTIKENGRLTIGDAVRKTIELMEESFSNQFRDKIDDRVEEIAMEKAKDINGIPVRTLIAKDILNTLIEKAYLKTDVIYKDMAQTAVAFTDELMKALKK
jgi:bifunctional DNA-binding transcriptional regulator/antitoxin component of YhaV-PrlF toxin-antitoxin module